MALVSICHHVRTPALPPTSPNVSASVITQNPALIVDGKLQHDDGVIHVKAQSIRALRCEDLPEQASHDFH